MTFISAQPWDPYFQWQIEVQILNFRKHNLSDKMHVLVWYPPHGKLEPWHALSEKYKEVKFFFYPDKGVDLVLYIPQLRPHILKEHFKLHPELTKDVIFYHDSDIIFNYLPNFEKLSEGDICWQSNTTGYLDYSYLCRKEDQGKLPRHTAIQVLADIGGVTVETIKSYDGKTGGAQCVLKGIDADFWEDVERQVLLIRKAFFHGSPNSINKRHFPSEAAGFQSWCADMWALNFALWKRGKVTDVTTELDFSWATDNYTTYLQKPIYHNAGATKAHVGVFRKNEWIDRSPLRKTHVVRQDSATRAYVAAMAEVK